MESLDSNLKKLRLPLPAVALLENASVTDFAVLLESQNLLEEVRKHLNPIQHSKLNALIKEFEKIDEDASDYNGTEVLLNAENNASRNEILGQLVFERQCLEELNSIIVDDSDEMTAGAKQIVQKSKAAHQARANRLNGVLRSKPDKDKAEGEDNIVAVCAKKKKLHTKQVRFEVSEAKKDGEIFLPYLMRTLVRSNSIFT